MTNKIIEDEVVASTNPVHRVRHAFVRALRSSDLGGGGREHLMCQVRASSSQTLLYNFTDHWGMDGLAAHGQNRTIDRLRGNVPLSLRHTRPMYLQYYRELS